MFNFKIQKNWKAEGRDYFKEKLQRSLFKTRIYIVVQSTSRDVAIGKLQSVFTNFQMFKNYPLNQFKLKINTFDEITLPVIAKKAGAKLLFINNAPTYYDKYATLRMLGMLGSYLPLIVSGV